MTTILLLFAGNRVFTQDKIQNYAFLVAGHAYGSHQGKNLGLYPKFLEFLKSDLLKKISLIVFAGDTVRKSTPAAWQQVRDELDPLRIPYFFVMGNHDFSNYSVELFQKTFGNTYYSHTIATEKLIILDCQSAWGNIPAAQLEFLKDELRNSGDIQNVFVFFHELLWASYNKRYRNIRHNYGSYEPYFKSNFWEQVFPILKEYSNKNIYVIAGDVGGNGHAAPAFYEKHGHITLLATGMGAIRDENVLLVQVKNGKISFNLIPLNNKNTLLKIEEYTVENLNP